MPTSFKKTSGGDGIVQADEFQAGASDASLNDYTLNAYFADANTAGSIFVAAPQAGKIVGLYAVNGVANTTAQTVLTPKIATVAVTTPAWDIAAAQAAGTLSSTVPTALNTVAAGDVIEIASDGGGTPSMPLQVTILIKR